MLNVKFGSNAVFRYFFNQRRAGDMGQRVGFSSADLAKINRMYQCSNDRRGFSYNNGNQNYNNQNNNNNFNGNRNPFRLGTNALSQLNSFFGQYTSPRFWQGALGLFNNWLFPQNQNQQRAQDDYYNGNQYYNRDYDYGYGK